MKVFPAKPRPRRGDRLLEKRARAAPEDGLQAKMGPSGELVRMTSCKEEAEEEEEDIVFRRSKRQEGENG